MNKNHHHKSPPRLAQRLLSRLLKDELAEEVLGDLDEKFYQTQKQYANARAKRNYWYQVLNYLRPFALKAFKVKYSNFNSMFKHNLLVSYRNLLRNKTHSAINIGGLAMGLTVALLIGLWVADELNFNRYHSNYDRIVQVMNQRSFRGEIRTNTSNFSQLAPHLAENYPDFFEKVVLTPYRPEEVLLSVDKANYNEMGRYIQDGGPEMLGLKMKRGAYGGLEEMNSIMLSETLAKKLFGDRDPLDQTVRLRAQTDLKVTGIYEDIPKNSTFGDAAFMISFKRWYDNDPAFFKWDNYNCAIYAQLKPGVTAEQVSDAIKDVIKPHLEADNIPTVFVKPMRDWHLTTYDELGVERASERVRFIWLYATIGLFVLLLACINFMNLSTAQSQKRMREVGVRKAIGSVRAQLIRQFLAESTLYAFSAYIISIMAAFLLLPWFNGISEKSMVMPFSDAPFWGLSLAVVFITALLAGGYPAFYLSSFRPVRALHGAVKFGKGGVRLRQVLVVFQFTISIALIVGTITIHRQTEHARNRPIGYTQEGLITLRAQNREYADIYQTLRTELKNTGMVTEIAQANYPLTNDLGQNEGFKWRDQAEGSDVSFNTIFVRHEYGAAVGWDLLQGRDFSREFASDLNGVVITESAAKAMQFENPIGEKIRAPFEVNGSDQLTILGVVSDLVKESPFATPKPAIMFLTEFDLRFLFIRINPDVSMAQALPKIEKVWAELAPTHPFNYQFVDEVYANKFREEERISSLAGFFSTLAILISCLGLYGLASFVAEQRSKEVGIRKILGASLSQLWQLLSRDFAVLVGIACLVAIPLAAYILQGWLNDYEYNIGLEWWTFGLAGVGALIVTLITVSSQMVKAALVSPVKALRSE